MSNAARPRYPKPRPRRARPGLVPPFILLLALSLGLAVWLGPRLFTQGESSPPAALTAAAPSRAASPASGTRGKAQGVPAGAAQPAPPGKGAQPGPDQGRSAGQGANAGAASKELSAKVPPPFADRSLEQIAAHLVREYRGVQPVAFGERLEGITTALPVGPQGEEGPVLALTLDACGGKKGASYDAALIAFLREHDIPATIFVTSLWMRANPEALADLAGDPLFEIAGHGARHRPCSVNGKSIYGVKGTASFDELLAEVEGNARDIEKATGRRPRWFRSGTAYYDDIAVQVIHRLGLGIAGYSIAGDEGATLPPAKVAAKTLAARHGDILLLHMNKPRGGTRQGLELALPVLLERGARFVRLSDIFRADIFRADPSGADSQ